MTADTAELNWAGNVSYTAHALHTPSTLEELQSLVAGADRVKALGTRHSFTTIADSPAGILVSLAGLDPTIEIDHETMTATVPGALPYGVVADALEAEGLALANLGSLPHISVAGGSATGTHGSGDTNQVLAGEISGIELVTADGTLVTIDRSHPDHAALAIGLGAFGIITRLTLDLVPSYQMRQDMYHDIDWVLAHENFDELLASAYSVNIHSGYSTPNISGVISKSRDLSPAPETLLGGRRDPDDSNRGPQHTPRDGSPGPWSRRLPHFLINHPPSMGGDELQTDYMVARHDASAAIQALQAMGDLIDPHLWGTEIRSVAADDLWMSPAFGRDSVSIGFTWRQHVSEVTGLLAPIEAALAPFEPRPHWGKLFAIPPSELRRRLPKYDDFLALVSTYDPTGKFSNPFLEGLRRG